MNFAYTYDSRGNITSETRNGVITTYEYDELGQLTRVNDPNDTTAGASGTTWVYTYDRGGNMKERIAYEYSTAEQPSNFIQMWINHYDPNWKDKLLDSNGITVDYDANGNPTEYWGWNYTWEKGRQLKKAHYIYGDPVTLEFKYNKSGLRTQKVKKVRDVITETTDYVMSNKTLISMKKGIHPITGNYHYDFHDYPCVGMIDYSFSWMGINLKKEKSFLKKDWAAIKDETISIYLFAEDYMPEYFKNHDELVIDYNTVKGDVMGFCACPDICKEK